MDFLDGVEERGRVVGDPGWCGPGVVIQHIMTVKSNMEMIVLRVRICDSFQETSDEVSQSFVLDIHHAKATLLGGPVHNNLLGLLKLVSI